MAKPKEDTPLLKQYFSIKAQNPEAVLLFRVGDFYESYSDDALITSKVLGIVLTRKSNGEKGDTPMAGIPHHALAQYLPKLVRAGYKVAICDQLEDPKLAQAKLVKRGITEILTPGIAFGEGMLEQKEHNWLCGLCFDNDQVGAAFLDASTGTFRVAQGSLDYISTLLASFSPKELVVQRDCVKGARERFGDYYITPLEEWAFVYDSAAEKLRSQLRVESLKGFGVESFPLAICSGTDASRGPAEHLRRLPHRRGQVRVDGPLHHPQPGDIRVERRPRGHQPGGCTGPLLVADGCAPAAFLALDADNGPGRAECPLRLRSVLLRQRRPAG